jgi:GDP-L-fucose synthase
VGVVGFEGEIGTDATKPDGTPRKLMDVTRMKGTGWEPKIGLEAGLRSTYADFCRQLEGGGMRGA